MDQQTTESPAEKPKEEVKLPIPSIKAIVDHWAFLGMTEHRSGTKLMKKIDTAIRRLRLGTFFDDKSDYLKHRDRRFTDKEIVTAINNFALAATNPDYEPTPGGYKNHLRSMSLLAFFYDEYGTEGSRSLFVRYLESAPLLLKLPAREIPDPDPHITNVLKNFYIKKVLGGVETELPIVDMNKFRKATALTLEFFNSHKNKLQDYVRARGMIEFAHSVCRAMRDNVDESVGGDWKKVTPGWFCSDVFFNKALPAYLNGQDMLM